MSKLLQTQLPIASDTVTSDLFNRLVRILEINLGSVDLDNVRQLLTQKKIQLNLMTVASSGIQQ